MSDEETPLGYLRRQLDSEAARKTSLDQRTVAVLTAAAGAIAVGFSLAQVNTNFKTLLHSHHYLEGMALGLFGLSLALGIFSSILTYGSGPNVSDLRQVVQNAASYEKTQLIEAFGTRYLDEYTVRRSSNNLRSVLLLIAQLSQAVGIGSLLYLAWLLLR